MLIIADLLGVLIGWIDSRPTWDDTGVIVAMVLGASTFLAFTVPSRLWIWELSVGICIPLWNILLADNYGSLLSLGVALIGETVGICSLDCMSSIQCGLDVLKTNNSLSGGNEHIGGLPSS